MEIYFQLTLDTFQYELVKSRGYPAEIHRILTSDRYVLEMHRIPGSPSSPPRPGKIPVYLQHGLLDSSGGWVIMGVKNSLGKINFKFFPTMLVYSVSLLNQVSFLLIWATMCGWVMCEVTDTLVYILTMIPMVVVVTVDASGIFRGIK